MNTSRFCDACGAALPANAAACPFCGKAVTSVSFASTPPPGPRRVLRPIVSVPAPAPAIAPGPGATLAGRYYLEKKIGEGGFGAVYKARDWGPGQNGKVVAVKQINMAALSAQEKIEATDSYNRESTLLSALNHRRGLPHVRDHFTDPEHWYVVMDYIPGRTLEEILAATPGGRLPVAQVIEIGCKLCDVLSYLHQQNPPIIFRDIKPGNIMLTAWGEVYLIDFGIARRYQVGKSKDTMPLGSPGYAAPEQYGKGQSSVQTDIYGLGATLQTLLTGCEPLDIRINGMPPDCKIPFKLQALINNMLDPDPGKRPESARAVKDSLHRSSSFAVSLNVPAVCKSLLFFFTVQAVVETLSSTGQIWLAYLILILAIILARNVYTWRYLRMLAFPVATIGGMLKLIGLRVFDAIYYAAALALPFQGIYILLHPNLLPAATTGLMYSFYGLFIVLIELRRFWQWLQDLRAAQRRTQQAQNR